MWTALRHQYTQTAILYEKQLKPFSKILHEGRGEPGVSASVRGGRPVCVCETVRSCLLWFDRSL